MHKSSIIFLTACLILLDSSAWTKDKTSAPLPQNPEDIPSIVLPEKELAAPLKEKKAEFTADHPFNLALISTYMKNPLLQAKARAQYATDEKVAQAVSEFRPTIKASGTISETHGNVVNSAAPDGASSLERPLTGGVSITQPIYDGGRSLHGLSRAEKEVMAGRQDFIETEQKVLLDAANAYFDLWQKQAIVELNKKNIKAKKKRLKEAQARFDVGELTLTDLAQAESQVAEALARKISADADYANSLSTYIRVIGEEPSELTPPPPLEKIFTLPESKKKLVDLSLKNNPTVQRAAYLREAAKYDVYAKEGVLLPSLSAEGAANQSFQLSGNQRAQSVQGLLRLTIPLYQSGAEYSAIRQSIESENQVKLDLRRIRQEAIEAAEKTWENFFAAKARMEQFHSQMKAAELSLEGTHQEHLVGERTLLDVFDAENKLLEVQVSYLQAQTDYLVGGYQLLSVIGHMTARQLKLPVEQYDLEGHYNEVKNKLFGLGESPRR